MLRGHLMIMPGAIMLIGLGPVDLSHLVAKYGRDRIIIVDEYHVDELRSSLLHDAISKELRTLRLVDCAYPEFPVPRLNLADLSALIKYAAPPVQKHFPAPCRLAGVLLPVTIPIAIGARGALMRRLRRVPDT